MSEPLWRKIATHSEKADRNTYEKTRSQKVKEEKSLMKDYFTQKNADIHKEKEKRIEKSSDQPEYYREQTIHDELLYNNFLDLYRQINSKQYNNHELTQNNNVTKKLEEHAQFHISQDSQSKDQQDSIVGIKQIQNILTDLKNNGDSKQNKIETLSEKFKIISEMNRKKMNNLLNYLFKVLKKYCEELRLTILKEKNKFSQYLKSLQMEIQNYMEITRILSKKESRNVEVQTEAAIVVQKKSCDYYQYQKTRINNNSELESELKKLKSVVLLKNQLLQKKDQELKTITQECDSLKLHMRQLQKKFHSENSYKSKNESKRQKPLQVGCCKSCRIFQEKYNQSITNHKDLETKFNKLIEVLKQKQIYIKKIEINNMKLCNQMSNLNQQQQQTITNKNIQNTQNNNGPQQNLYLFQNSQFRSKYRMLVQKDKQNQILLDQKKKEYDNLTTLFKNLQQKKNQIQLYLQQKKRQTDETILENFKLTQKILTMQHEFQEKLETQKKSYMQLEQSNEELKTKLIRLTNRVHHLQIQLVKIQKSYYYDQQKSIRILNESNSITREQPKRKPQNHNSTTLKEYLKKKYDKDKHIISNNTNTNKQPNNNNGTNNKLPSSYSNYNPIDEGLRITFNPKDFEREEQQQQKSQRNIKNQQQLKKNPLINVNIFTYDFMNAFSSQIKTLTHQLQKQISHFDKNYK